MHACISARRAQSSARTCLRAAHRCCDMHAMRCAIIWSKLGARRRKRLYAPAQPSARSYLRDAHCCCDTHCCALLLSMRCRRLLRSSFDHRIFFKKSSPRKCSLTLSMPRISSSVKWGKRVRRGHKRRGVRKTKTRFGAIIRQTLLIAFRSTKFHDHSFQTC